MKTTTTSNQRSDLYTRVTERVVADLERGVRSWLKPWTSGNTRITVPSRHNGIPYRGINVLILWSAAARLFGPERAHLPPGARARRQCPQRRARHVRRVRRPIRTRRREAARPSRRERRLIAAQSCYARTLPS